MRLMFAARAIDRMAGGVERMIITIMNAMVERGHHVDLFTWDQCGADAFYPMSPDIKWHRLDVGDPARKAGPRLLLERTGTIRTLVRQSQPQVIVGFQDGPFLAMRLYCFGLRIPVIAAERNAPTRFYHTRAGKRQRFIYFNAFRLAKSVIIQHENYRRLYPGYLRDRISVIPNPVSPARLAARPDQPDKVGRFHILSVGRLSYQKNYASLIIAFAKIAERFPAWDLKIVGAGEDRPRLEALILERRLSDRISLPGTVTEPGEAYASAHLFCLSSRWEGFPNALAEAQAHGLPAAGYAQCAGVSDLIADGVTGRLAAGNGDSDGLAATLAELMSDGARRVRMGCEARKTVGSFKPEPIMDLWEKTLLEAVPR
jgi:glycosyltransferase involved in cell wall biosynthesis